MKKNILYYGIMAGILASLFQVINTTLYMLDMVKPPVGIFLGYAMIFLALYPIFPGVRAYRELHGSLPFLKALGVALLITSIAATLYYITWEISYHTYASDFTQKYTENTLAVRKQEGASEAELDVVREEMRIFSEAYQNPFVRFFYTIIEIFPAGILLSIIAAFLHRSRSSSDSEPA
jgi:hypothetical protein